MTNNNGDNHVGKRVRHLREAILKLPQKSFSEELKLTQATISQIENGGNHISSNFINALTERFPDLNLNWLFYNEGKPLRRQEQLKDSDVDAKLSDLANKIKRLEDDNSKLISFITSQHSKG